MTMVRIDGSWWRRAGALVLAGAMAACGGGGGGSDGGGGNEPTAPSGPPATAATLADTSADAMNVTQAAVSAADGLVSREGSLSGLSALLGAPVTGAAPGAGVASLGRQGRMQAQAVTTVGCADLDIGTCTGTATLDTDIADTATSVSPGQYIDVTFSSVSGFLFGQSISFDGRLRITFLTAFNETTTSLAGIGLRISATAFTVSAGGATYGPITETSDINFDANGVPSVVVDGARYGALSGVTVTGQGTYTISSGSARLGYGANKTGYVDVSLANWHSNAGRPVAGSTATLTVPGWQATITVFSSSSTTVVYDVVIVNTGTNASGGYRVTATYPEGGGAPTYSAVGS